SRHFIKGTRYTVVGRAPRTFVRQLARSTKTVSPCREPAVGRPQNRHRAGEPCQRRDGRHPPDGARDFDQGVRSAQVSSVRCYQAHFVQKSFGLQAKPRLHPGRLESCELEPAPPEHAVSTRHPGATEGTISIVESPAAVTFCNFSIHRNISSKKLFVAQTQRLKGFVPQSGKFRKRARGPAPHLLIPTGGGFKKVAQFGQPCPGKGVLFLIRFGEAFAKHRERGV